MTHPKHQPKPQDSEELFFAEDVDDRNVTASSESQFRAKRRSAEHSNSTVLRVVVAEADMAIQRDETSLNQQLSLSERTARNQAATDAALAGIDRQAWQNARTVADGEKKRLQETHRAAQHLRPAT